ncbi:MAG: hypothetical protein KME42_14000 [Tildeniella nuda ZEHNDER 1965/U140]|nr:hypothetical protein [Tildeniella nuda ZEHNDER 1965/U140]
MNQTNPYQFPQPKYKAGQHIQTEWRTDDTKELVIEQGVIIALTYTDYEADRHHYESGFTYHVQFYKPRVFVDDVPENDIEIIGDIAMSQSTATSRQYKFPQPKFEEGQHVQTPGGNCGVVSAFTYTTDTEDCRLEPGFNYRIDFYKPIQMSDVSHESKLFPLDERGAMERLIIAVPESVPVPKFQLFEEAFYGKHKGVIVAMAYENPFEALRHNSEPGWRYDLSYSLNRTPLEAVSVSEDDTLIYEDSLSRCSC